jgi:hypothetical protein
MSTLDFDMNFEDGQQDEADKRLLVKFTLQSTYVEHESITAGRPIYKDEETIQIMAPGSRDVTSGLVTEEYKRRFPKQYARFKAGHDQLQTGTPLSALVWMTPAQIAELNAVNCFTVEQLANMPDNLSQKFMGAQALKQRAQKYLDIAKDQAPMLMLQAELEKRDEQLAQLQKQMEVLQAMQPPPKAAVKA